MKFGIIGTNFISDKFCKAAEETGQCSLTAVMSRSREKGESFALSHNIEKVCTNMEELAASGIDGVYIATPNALHASQAKFFLEKGIHVLGEKPAASNLAELDEILAASYSSKAVYMEAMRPLHDTAWLNIKKNLHRIGRIRRADFEFCQYSSRYDRYLAGEYTNTFDPSLSNAGIMDIGVYPIHMLLWLFGRPSDVQANSVKLEGAAEDPFGGYDACGSVTLMYDGFYCEAVYSKITQSVSPSVIQGELGAIVIDKISEPSDVKLILRGGSGDNTWSVSENLHVSGENMCYEINDFVNLVKKGEYRHEYNVMSRLCAETVDRARKCTGTVFPADIL